MAIVYPMSLGLLEGVTQLTIKALTAVSSYLGQPCCFASGWTWLFLLLFCGIGPLTVVWLRIVYTRYETMTGLPTEYGTVQFCSCLGGYIFYQEQRYMEAWQNVLLFVGLIFVACGVTISTWERFPASFPCAIRGEESSAAGEQ
jgi:hypothetical protein